MTTTSHHRQENTSYIFEMAVTLGLHNRDTVIEISCECNPKMFAEHERTPKQNYIIKPNVIHLKSFVAWKPCRSRAGRNAILFNI